MENLAQLDYCHLGDCREVMRDLIAAGVKVHTCVTSPPYFGLRDYQTGTWQGGDPNCDHSKGLLASKSSTLKNDGRPNPGRNNYEESVLVPYRDTCGKCGAARIDRQIGLESSMDEYIATMVEVFRLVRELLRDDGTCWINIGDSFVGSNKGVMGDGSLVGGPKQRTNTGTMTGAIPKAARIEGLAPKNLMGIPWRLALALQADGWILRQEIIWHKLNPMPESVRDRFTKAHETIFLLSKSPRYYFDQNAIKEPCTQEEMANGFRGGAYVNHATLVNGEGGKRQARGNYRTPTGWDTSTGEGGHGAFHKDGRGQSKVRGHERPHQGFNDRWDHMSRAEQTSGMRSKRSVWSVATQPFGEAHFATYPKELIKPCILAGAPPGGIVFDPFLGSGTTAEVAQDLGRRWIGVELNPDYLKLQARRTAQAGLILETET